MTAFANGTHVLFWIWKEELQISLHFLPEGQSFSLHNLWYLKISRKHRAWDSPKSRICRKESLCWKGQEGQCPWVTAVLLSKHWVCCRSPFHAENLPARAMQAALTVPVAEGGQIGWVKGWQRCYQNTPWKMSPSCIWTLLWPPKLIFLSDKWFALFALLGATIKVPKCKAFICQDMVYSVSFASIILFSNLSGSPQNSEAIQGWTDKMKERQNYWGSMTLSTAFCEQITTAHL